MEVFQSSSSPALVIFLIGRRGRGLPLLGASFGCEKGKFHFVPGTGAPSQRSNLKGRDGWRRRPVLASPVDKVACAGRRFAVRFLQAGAVTRGKPIPRYR